jgi:hypothetical protein
MQTICSQRFVRVGDAGDAGDAESRAFPRRRLRRRPNAAPAREESGQRIPRRRRSTRRHCFRPRSRPGAPMTDRETCGGDSGTNGQLLRADDQSSARRPPCSTASGRLGLCEGICRQVGQAELLVPWPGLLRLAPRRVQPHQSLARVGVFSLPGRLRWQLEFFVRVPLIDASNARVSKRRNA